MTSPLPVGAYRYMFLVDSVSMLDPKNLDWRDYLRDYAPLLFTEPGR